MILNHALDVQLLDGNQPVLVYQTAGKLVDKIMAAISDTLMDAGQNLICFSARFTAFCRSALLSCRFRECLFVATEETRVGYKRTIGQGGELIQAHINTNYFIFGTRQSR